MKKKKGYYSISAVAEMFEVHQQTIRLYEREGLISPKRSDGNTRIFTEEDVERLEEVIYLTHKLGINLAGVDMILKQERKIKRLQKEINTLFNKFQHELNIEKDEKNEQITVASRRMGTLKKRFELDTDPEESTVTPAEIKKIKGS
jgi:MerR family transcriptional regulator, heat shock protein HspR